VDNTSLIITSSIPTDFIKDINGTFTDISNWFNPLNAELNPICYLLALFGAHHFLHVSRIRVNPYPANVENMMSS